ncbi:FAD-binding oxidoreductase [Sphingomonas sp. 2R-10]|uniref:NAD(P)/FAD-dependent oxidoreductase n=1 Tax=Sphingomonas sp. 2R-10 TaxID=3045148 RepID=UPI000F7AF1E0|nr:FAD-binding oxidoreductase [Sphingomonas sp. 2R-10]MDJ0275649.1 FAD-binding oxidoreductase [Sphingomonas sp. 2R-10]
MARIVIVGGGVVGLSCAVALADRGHGVTLYDASAGREAASWGNAGHIATEQTAPLASLASLRSLPRRLSLFGGPLSLPPRQIAAWMPFAAGLIAAAAPRRFAAGQAALKALLHAALPTWRTLDTRLGGGLLAERGHVVAWESAQSATRGMAHWAAQDIGTTCFAPTEAPFGTAAAIRFAGTAQVSDLDRLARALEREARAGGVAIVRAPAALVVEGGRARVVGQDADLVLVTAGVRSGALLRAAGHRVPIVAERGYHVRAAADRWPVDLPPIVFEDRSIIVTRYADRVQVAGFVEPGDADAPPDPRRWRRLERHVAELGLPIAGPFTRWMGSRPTLPDYLPAIGRSDRAANLLYAFGHQYLGLTLAPVTATLVAALANGSRPAIDLAPFTLDRFDRRR